MTTAPAMLCTRCNKLTGETGKCSTCGTTLKPLASQQRRGWVAFAAAAFLAVFVAGVWIWIDRLYAAQGGVPNSSEAQFYGRINVAFGLLLLTGILGIASGWQMARSGRRNLVLVIALVVTAIAAFIVAFTATNGYQPS